MTATTAVLDYADETFGSSPDSEMIPLWQNKGRLKVDANSCTTTIQRKRSIPGA